MKITNTKRNASYELMFLAQDALITKLSQFLAQKKLNLCIITDHILKHHYASLLSTIEQACHASTVIIEAGESSKNIQTVTHIHERMLEQHYGRNTGVLCFGGGVVSDIGGFVAGTYFRGVPYITIPTTLLAMVDSCIGGKTGVNLNGIKNCVGLFYPPQIVYLCLEFLKTLPEQHIFSGFAEIIKYSIISGKKDVLFLEQHCRELLGLESSLIQTLVKRSLEIKASFIAQDPSDFSQRRFLNYGHTFGHALESATQYSISHGEAVALGMQAAAAVSYSLGYLSKAELLRHNKLIQAYGLPTVWPNVNLSKLLSFVTHDKKCVNGTLSMVLIRSLGSPFIAQISVTNLQRIIPKILTRV